MNIIEFPKYYEVDIMLTRFNIAAKDVDKELIWEAIFEVRQKYGLFEKNKFRSVVELLKHDWLPSDIPVILPEPSNMWWR